MVYASFCGLMIGHGFLTVGDVPFFAWVLGAALGEHLPLVDYCVTGFSSAVAIFNAELNHPEFH